MALLTSQKVLMLLGVTGLTLAAANNSSCPKGSSHIPDCERKDFGSCGNACCGVSQLVPLGVTAAYQKLKQYLYDNGAEGYSYVTGPDSAGHNPSDDLRHFNISWKYVLQGRHVTTGGYVDTLNFNIVQISSAVTQINAFSISNIHSALGDNGQNFKTLAYLFQGMSVDVSAKELKIEHGCGKQTSHNSAPKAESKIF